MKKSVFVLLFVLFLAPASALAQMSLPTIDPMVLTTFARQDVLSQHLMQLEEESEAASQEAEALDFSYDYDSARTRQNMRAFVARTPNPVAKSELQALFSARPGIMEDIRVAYRGYGFDPDNMVDAYALWWMNAWLVSVKRDEDPDRATIEAVKRQVNAAFVATPGFTETGDAARQEYAEALLLQAALLAASFEEFHDKPALLDQLAKAASQGASASCLDLSKMTLTKDGFVPRPK